MRLRLIASFAFAACLVGLALVSAATFVSALDRHAILDDAWPRDPEAGYGASARLTLGGIRLESSCDELRRELHALSHAVSRCELTPECKGSPLLCPRALDARIDREYERLRDALHAHCGFPSGLLDFAWAAGVTGGVDEVDLAEGCEVAHDGWEAAARGEARPESYSF